MNTQQPGVTVIDKAPTAGRAPVRSAVPLFIGYTESGPAFALRHVGGTDEMTALFGGPPDGVITGGGGISTLWHSVNHYFKCEGADAFVLSLGSYADAAENTTAAIIAALADPRIARLVRREDRITLVSMPDLAMLPDADIAAWQAGWQALLSLCACRPGLFGLLDAPDASQAALDCLGSFEGSAREEGAAYWPRLAVMQAGRTVVIPPSAAVAAAIERVDRQSGVWTAPANVALDHVIGPTRPHVEVEDAWVRGHASFNLIRAFPGRGTRIWGCRTLGTDGRSPGRYVQVRRLSSYVQTHVRQLVQMFLFEPNSELTWFKVKGQVTNWLRELWMLGGLYGAEEAEAFEVMVGLQETMTEADVASGLMVLRIRLCSLHPAEFIELVLQFEMGAAVAPADA